MQPEVQQRILGYFIEEARDHLTTLEQGLMELRRPDEDGERMKELFRAAHSIKGGAAMLSLQPIRSIAHRLEDHFKTLQDNPIAVSQTLESLLLRSVDILQGLVSQLQAPGGSDPEYEVRAVAEAEPLMQRIERCLLGEAVEPLEASPLAIAVAPAEAPRLDLLAQLFANPEALAAFTVDALLEPAAPDLSTLFTLPEVAEASPEDLGAVEPALEPVHGASARPRETGAARRTMRVEVRLLDGLNNMVGELVVNRNSLETQQNRLYQFLETLQGRARHLNRVSQTLAEHYDKSILGVSAGHGNGNGNSTDTNYDEQSFDALEMDQYTVFHTISQEIMELIVRVREVTSDIEFVADEADAATRQLRYISTQLQGGLNKIRMLPLAEIVDRLPRAVRDLSISFGKDVDLVLDGREMLFDKAILEELYDPLTHLVTNALMHGLETPQTRAALGKPVRGRIDIRAYHQGNQTLIAVSDDGQGLDIDRIRERAIERRLISPEQAQQLSSQELYPFIFTPGFSTALQVNEFAGRGVGLDVVQNHLTRMRGTIQIDSRPGQGTTFTIRLPLSLSISRAVICLHRHSPVAIPLDSIEEMLELSEEQVYTRGDKRHLQWRDRELPFVSLIELLPYPRVLVAEPTRPTQTLSTVILRSGETYLAIGVDSFLEEQEIVIKPLRGPVERPLGIAGVTVLGSGQTLPIVDVGELVGIITGQMPLTPWALNPQPLTAAPATQQAILIVDDSITVRELLSLTFSKAGYRVEQARDGQEALEKLQAGLACDAVFCDVEMPRMDGFEFLGQLQKDGRFAHLPVAMLTSRSADKHRHTAHQLGAKGYFTKPYLEDELLQGAVRLLKGEKVGHDPGR